MPAGAHELGLLKAERGEVLSHQVGHPTDPFSLGTDRRLPRMYQETASQLLEHLEHPHGWWRDTAQKLLVLRQDMSVAPALKTMARKSGNQLARIHALWTLEGLQSLDGGLARDHGVLAAGARERVDALVAEEARS